eukprot:m.112623 g.112623  ORF g.112623 m.112623 type:complete len:838 (+) comp37445_c0_seq1:51-2564(+)
MPRRVHPSTTGKEPESFNNGILLEKITESTPKETSSTEDGQKRKARLQYTHNRSLSSHPKKLLASTRRSQYDSHLDTFSGQSARRKPIVTDSKKAVQLQEKCQTTRRRRRRVTASPALRSGVDEADGMALPGIVPEEELCAEKSGTLPKMAVSAIKGSFAVAGSHFQMTDRRILDYFAKLGGLGSDVTVRVNFSYLDELIRDGASVNAVDDLGQTALHEVAREWGVDVAQFLLDRGALIDCQDSFGRAPLHVAASCDAVDMVRWLIENGADLGLCTHGELQTPLHFAARSDAIDCLRIMLEAKCDIENRDYKGRTPLQIAAELDRSESVSLLLDVKPRAADAGVKDYSGHSALSSMVRTMPPVMRTALNQLHRTSRVQRKQLYYLNFLEKAPPEMTGSNGSADVFSPLEMIVHYKHFDLITHPVIKKLIDVKWNQFGRTGAILQLIIHMLFLTALTIYTVAVSYENKHNYLPLQDHWWRLFAAVIILGLFLFQVIEELLDVTRSRRQHTGWVKWRTREHNRDLHFCHPKYPEEKKYLLQEIKQIHDSGPAYFSDGWNLIDWLSYILLSAAIIAHVIDVVDHSESVAVVHARLDCIALIVAWIRLLKFVRGFPFIGLFVVILQHMVADVVRFVFVYVVIFVPYAASFWVFFGNRSVPGFYNVSMALFSLYRITLVDEYAYDEMKKEDSIMADILVGTFLALAAVVGLNLFIALMSDTFQRVYDNAKANAVMLRASITLSLEEKLTKNKLNAYRREIHTIFAPLEEFYDDDENESEDLKKITVQTYEEIGDLKNLVEEVSEKLQQEERDSNLNNRLAAIEQSLLEIKTALRHLKGNVKR